MKTIRVATRMDIIDIATLLLAYKKTSVNSTISAALRYFLHKSADLIRLREGHVSEEDAISILLEHKVKVVSNIISTKEVCEIEDLDLLSELKEACLSTQNQNKGE